jgi:hypothetical protein
MITRDTIVEGLTILVLQLANDADVPDDWESHEWAYVKGIASATILRLQKDLEQL